MTPNERQPPEPLPTRTFPLGEREPVVPPSRDEDSPAPDEPTPTRRPRFTVTGSVVHQQPGEQAKQAPRSRFYRWLDQDQDPYERTVKVGEDWTPLDLGWVGTEGSLLLLANATRATFTVRPTREQLADLYSKVLEVGLLVKGVVTDFAEVPVGEDLRLSPRRLDAYRVRCRSGQGKYSIFLVPA